MSPESVCSSSASTRVVAIVGPTGVGKTALAEELACRLRGEIISADSMQVYRGMDVGTAKPALSERRVPYHCLDLAQPGESFSAALYQASARAAISDCSARGVLPILCGGTGLYVRAALDPLEFPAGDQDDNSVRSRYEAYAELHGAPALHALLAEHDPNSAALIHVNNTRRVVRALEMLEADTSYAEQHAGFSARESLYDATFLGLTMERAALYARIDARVDQMIERGLLGEVEGLLERGLRGALTAGQAIGYKELVPVLEGGADLGEAVEQIKQSSRRYAKRQLTWFRADPRVRWIDVTELSLDNQAAAALVALESTCASVRPGGD